MIQSNNFASPIKYEVGDFFEEGKFVYTIVKRVVMWETATPCLVDPNYTNFEYRYTVKKSLNEKYRREELQRLFPPMENAEQWLRG
jgi:hypothetical protein